MNATRHPAAAIDAVMEKASRALVETEYFNAERLALRALALARRAADFERLARIVLPLQEARRQRRHEACDSGAVHLLTSMPSPRQVQPGAYLLAPPLVGIAARDLRDAATRGRIPVMVLAREPATREGLWPLVAVGSIGAGVGLEPSLGQREPVVVRTKVAPPSEGRPDVAWMLAAQEALGDAAIARVDRAAPADHRVDDLLEFLDAVPDHEKLAQAFEAAARDAAREGPSGQTRRRPPRGVNHAHDPF